MKNFLCFWSISLPLIVILDYIWFSFAVERIYKPHIGFILSGDFNYFAAGVFYLLYSAGISYLILLPGLEANSTVFKILFNGFVLGLVAYGAYDLTNHATIKNWPLVITVIDMLWGTLVTGLASALSYLIFNWKAYFNVN